MSATSVFPSPSKSPVRTYNSEIQGTRAQLLGRDQGIGQAACESRADLQIMSGARSNCGGILAGRDQYHILQAITVDIPARV